MTDDNKEAFAVVGELVMMTTTLESILNQVVIAVLHLGEAPLLEPVVATLDGVRKVELLKTRAGHFTSQDWKKRVFAFTAKVESVQKQRNIACHTTPVLKDGVWSFAPAAAAKVLKFLDLENPTIRASSIDEFRAAIQTGEAALGEGLALIENFKRINIALSEMPGSSAAS